MNIEELKKRYADLVDLSKKIEVLFHDYDSCQSGISKKLIASAIEKYLAAVSIGQKKDEQQG